MELFEDLVISAVGGLIVRGIRRLVFARRAVRTDAQLATLQALVAQQAATIARLEGLVHQQQANAGLLALLPPSGAYSADHKGLPASGSKRHLDTTESEGGTTKRLRSVETATPAAHGGVQLLQAVSCSCATSTSASETSDEEDDGTEEEEEEGCELSDGNGGPDSGTYSGSTEPEAGSSDSDDSEDPSERRTLDKDNTEVPEDSSPTPREEHGGVMRKHSPVPSGASPADSHTQPSASQSVSESESGSERQPSEASEDRSFKEITEDTSSPAATGEGPVHELREEVTGVVFTVPEPKKSVATTAPPDADGAFWRAQAQPTKGPRMPEMPGFGGSPLIRRPSPKVRKARFVKHLLSLKPASSMANHRKTAAYKDRLLTWVRSLLKPAKNPSPSSAPPAEPPAPIQEGEEPTTAAVAGLQVEAGGQEQEVGRKAESGAALRQPVLADTTLTDPAAMPQVQTVPLRPKSVGFLGEEEPCNKLRTDVLSTLDSLEEELRRENAQQNDVQKRAAAGCSELAAVSKAMASPEQPGFSKTECRPPLFYCPIQKVQEEVPEILEDAAKGATRQVKEGGQQDSYGSQEAERTGQCAAPPAISQAAARQDSSTDARVEPETKPPFMRPRSPSPGGPLLTHIPSWLHSGFPSQPSPGYQPPPPEYSPHSPSSTPVDPLTCPPASLRNFWSRFEPDSPWTSAARWPLNPFELLQPPYEERRCPPETSGAFWPYQAYRSPRGRGEYFRSRTPLASFQGRLLTPFPDEHDVDDGAAPVLLPLSGVQPPNQQDPPPCRRGRSSSRVSRERSRSRERSCSREHVSPGGCLPRWYRQNLRGSAPPSPPLDLPARQMHGRARSCSWEPSPSCGRDQSHEWGHDDCGDQDDQSYSQAESYDRGQDSCRELSDSRDRSYGRDQSDSRVDSYNRKHSREPDLSPSQDQSPDQMDSRNLQHSPSFTPHWRFKFDRSRLDLYHGQSPSPSDSRSPFSSRRGSQERSCSRSPARRTYAEARASDRSLGETASPSPSRSLPQRNSRSPSPALRFKARAPQAPKIVVKLKRSTKGFQHGPLKCPDGVFVDRSSPQRLEKRPSREPSPQPLPQLSLQNEGPSAAGAEAPLIDKECGSRAAAAELPEALSQSMTRDELLELYNNLDPVIAAQMGFLSPEPTAQEERTPAPPSANFSAKHPSSGSEAAPTPRVDSPRPPRTKTSSSETALRSMLSLLEPLENSVRKTWLDKETAAPALDGMISAVKPLKSLVKSSIRSFLPASGTGVFRNDELASWRIANRTSQEFLGLFRGPPPAPASKDSAKTVDEDVVDLTQD